MYSSASIRDRVKEELRPIAQKVTATLLLRIHLVFLRLHTLPLDVVSTAVFPALYLAASVHSPPLASLYESLRVTNM